MLFSMAGVWDMTEQVPGPAQTTWLDRIKRNPVLVLIVAIMTAVIFLAQFTKALDKDGLKLFCKKPVEAVSDCYADFNFCSGLSDADCAFKTSQFPGRKQCVSGCS
jgi:hypothetical protein